MGKETLQENQGSIVLSYACNDIGKSKDTILEAQNGDVGNFFCRLKGAVGAELFKEADIICTGN